MGTQLFFFSLHESWSAIACRLGLSPSLILSALWHPLFSEPETFCRGVRRQAGGHADHCRANEPAAGAHGLDAQLRVCSSLYL